jgi:hypothetical protein
MALIAGTVSYLHMHLLVELHGQPGWVPAVGAAGGRERREPGSQCRRCRADGHGPFDCGVALVLTDRRVRTADALGPPCRGGQRFAPVICAEVFGSVVRSESMTAAAFDSGLLSPTPMIRLNCTPVDRVAFADDGDVQGPAASFGARRLERASRPRGPSPLRSLAEDVLRSHSDLLSGSIRLIVQPLRCPLEERG